MNEVTKWTFEENDVRTVMVEGEPYFVGKDVAQVLGYSNTKDALAKHVDDEDKKIIQRSQFTTLDVPNRGLAVINESGLYSLVLSSKLPTAKKFKRWVTSEVLPTIRKTGSYGIPTYADLSPQLQLLINIETRQREQERAIAETNQRLDNIGEVIALDVHSWRKDAQHLISKIATANGGFDSMKDIYNEIYRLVEERAGVSLSTRLTNKRRRMADEGVCKSKRDKLTKVDIIADDKKLIEIYIAIVKEMAVKSGVTGREQNHVLCQDKAE